jgi:hypothetical protein
MSASKRIWPILWVVLFVPVSSFLAGVMAYVMRLSASVSGGNGFWDVLRGYGPFWPGTFGARHIPSLVLSLAVLLLLAISTRMAKPLVTLFQIRIILLVLIALLTIFVKIFSVIEPVGLQTRDIIPLFLYADLDLVLVFFLTFLPTYRRSNAPLA